MRQPARYFFFAAVFFCFSPPARSQESSSTWKQDIRRTLRSLEENFDKLPALPKDSDINKLKPVQVSPADEALLPADALSIQPASEKPDLIVVPIPAYNPAFGFSLVVGAGMIYKLNPADKQSPPSMTGAVGYISQNSTWAAGI